jgi:hypothetical protein
MTDTKRRGPIAIYERFESLREDNPDGVWSFSYRLDEMQESVAGEEDVAQLKVVFDWISSNYRLCIASREPTHVPVLVRESAHLARIVLTAPWTETEIAFGD